VLLRALTEWLSLLRRIDPSKPNPVLLPVAVEQRDRVAVGNAHNPTLEDITPSGQAPEGESKQRRAKECVSQRLS
jgi:hypothetical protein